MNKNRSLGASVKVELVAERVLLNYNRSYRVFNKAATECVPTMYYRILFTL